MDDLSKKVLMTIVELLEHQTGKKLVIKEIPQKEETKEKTA